MIILKIIGVLLLIILVLLLAATCIPVCVGIKYDTVVTLKIKYLFVSFRKEFSEEEQAETKDEQALKEPTVFDKILTAVSSFIKQSRRAIKSAFSKAANFIKSALRKIRGAIRSNFKPKSKKKKSKKKSSASGGRFSKTKNTDRNLFAALREERGFWGAVKFFTDIAKMFGGGLVGMYRGIAANKFVLRVKIVGEDAADTAVKYGEICSFAFPALSFLLGSMRRYNQNIEITPDFNGDEGSIYFNGEFQIFPILIIGHALSAVLRFAVQQIKITLNNKERLT